VYQATSTRRNAMKVMKTRVYLVLGRRIPLKIGGFLSLI
jgi:hypothetical protein